MEVKTIENLPNEVLINVFELLESESMLNATLVSKK